jgi:hypothetical protein
MSVARLEKRAQEAADRALERFKGKLNEAYDRQFGSQRMTPDEQRNDYLLRIDDMESMGQMFGEWVQQYGVEQARGMLLDWDEEGMKSVDELLDA